MNEHLPAVLRDILNSFARYEPAEFERRTEALLGAVLEEQVRIRQEYYVSCRSACTLATTLPEFELATAVATEAEELLDGARLSLATWQQAQRNLPEMRAFPRNRLGRHG